MPKVLLHICCAGCASVSVEKLLSEGFEVEGLFFNPNIHPLAEYEFRRRDLSIISSKYRIKIHFGEYNPKLWFEYVKPFKDTPEGGARCQACFEFRLRKAFEFMKSIGADFFSTTLTISPHKNSRVINNVGTKISPEHFLFRDFKKQDGFKRSVVLSKEWGIYRQNYCGCVYSLLESRQRRGKFQSGRV